MKTWEYNVLKLNTPNSPKLFFINNFIEEEIPKVEGDYVEFGVFEGKSFLTISYLLSLKDKKIKCYGFDSFKGFPDAIMDHPNDDISKFDTFYNQNLIKSSHYQDILKLQQHKKFLENIHQEKLQHSDLSESGKFYSELNLKKEIMRKAKYLKIENIHLYECNFLEIDSYIDKLPQKISFCLLDADLYQSYEATLPLIWERLSNKGIIFLDEYYSLKFPGAKIATDEFRDKVKCSLFKIGNSGGFERWVIRKD